MSVQTILARARAGEPLTAEDAAALADEFKVAEAERLKADKLAASLKTYEVEVKLTLINALKTLKITAVGGKAFTCTHSTEDMPTVADWAAYEKYILETKDFSLLERRPGKAAIKERWDNGVDVPGIAKFPVDKLSFSKVKVK